MEKLIIIGIFVTIIGYLIYRHRKTKRLEKELYDIAIGVLTHMKVDWKRADANAKIRNVSTYRDKGVLVYRYITLDGDQIYMIGDNIVGLIRNKKFSFELNEILKVFYKEFANHSIKHVNFLKNKQTRTHNQNYTNYNKKTNTGNTGNSSGSNRKTDDKKAGPTKAKPKNAHATHPKWNVYVMLVSTANARKEHLVKVPKNDPSRINLENELKAVEGRIKAFKEKYKF